MATSFLNPQGRILFEAIGKSLASFSNEFTYRLTLILCSVFSTQGFASPRRPTCPSCRDSADARQRQTFGAGLAALWQRCSWRPPAPMAAPVGFRRLRIRALPAPSRPERLKHRRIRKARTFPAPDRRRRVSSAAELASYGAF